MRNYCHSGKCPNRDSEHVSQNFNTDQSGTLRTSKAGEAAQEHRSIAGQIEFLARVGRAALDNPDLPVSFVAESLASLAEPHELSSPFVPRSSLQ
ncbi:MAG: hypothetical protein WCK85_08600 [Chlorobium sp.]